MPFGTSLAHRDVVVRARRSACATSTLLRWVSPPDHGNSPTTSRTLSLPSLVMLFTEIHAQLLPEVEELFCDNVGAHLQVELRDRDFFLVIAGGGPSLHGPKSWTSHSVAEGDLDDQAGKGLLRRRSTGTRHSWRFGVTGDGVRYYRWLMNQRGSPVDQVEYVVRRTMDGAAFANAHPDASKRLAAAFELLWTGAEGPEVIRQIGEHLRSALQCMTTDLVGGTGGNEQVTPRLREHVRQLGIGQRESELLEALVEYADKAIRLDQRLAHSKDEADKGLPIRSFDEARRTAFATAMVCYELHSLRH
jgi:hypothetical protein